MHISPFLTITFQGDCFLIKERRHGCSSSTKMRWSSSFIDFNVFLHIFNMQKYILKKNFRFGNFSPNVLIIKRVCTHKKSRYRFFVFLWPCFRLCVLVGYEDPSFEVSLYGCKDSSLPPSHFVLKNQAPIYGTWKLFEARKIFYLTRNPASAFAKCLRPCHVTWCPFRSLFLSRKRSLAADIESSVFRLDILMVSSGHSNGNETKNE